MRLFAVLLIAAVLTGCAAPTTITRTQNGEVGQIVQDGKFSFTVWSVKPAEHWVGDPQPRGQWVIATIDVSSIGDQPQSFFVQNQKLIDTSGRTYAADSMAAMSMNKQSMVVDLNPGFTINVLVPFDVPVGTQLAALEVHDSMLSQGVKVTV